MNIRKPSFGRTLLFGVAATLALAGAAFASPPPDSWITTKVKIALMTADDVNANSVHVDTIDGQVTLFGKVRTDGERVRAQAATQKVEGVRGVRDLLQVVPASEKKMVARADDRIEDSLGKLLKDDPTLADSHITVKSVDKGVVLLTGKTDSMVDYLRAVETARSVPGVRRVASEVQSPDPGVDTKMIHERALKSAGKSAGKSGDSARDGWITTATKLRLIGDSDVPALDVNVDTSHGVVTLFGMVPTPAAKSSAEADAHKVDGVVAVENELQVVPKSKREFIEAKDDVIKKDVANCLATDDLKHINVDVKNAVVHLTGSVDNGWQRLRAARLARSQKGVRAVDDDLKVSE